MIHIKGNNCPTCPAEDLCWHLDIEKSDVHMFRCGHGTCKKCYNDWKATKSDFTCPICRETGQLHTTGRAQDPLDIWDTFAEWYNQFDTFIKAGAADNIIRNTRFGKQLLRLVREQKQANHASLRLRRMRGKIL